MSISDLLFTHSLHFELKILYVSRVGRGSRRAGSPSHRNEGFLFESKMFPRQVGPILVLIALALGCLLNVKHIGRTSDSIADVGSNMDTKVAVVIHRPFDMPLEGKGYEIYQPVYDRRDAIETTATVLGPPEPMIADLRERVEWVSAMTHNEEVGSNMSTADRAVLAYLELVKLHVSGVGYNDAELSVTPALRRRSYLTKQLNWKQRKDGMDWAYLGDTMTGFKRLDNVRLLLEDVIRNKVPGDYIETGVWRGGSSILARAVLRAHNQSSMRKLYVCDSFRGLPPEARNLDRRDSGWDKTIYLEVPDTIVAQNFQKYSLLDEQVIFAKGFFNDTIPPLSKHIDKLAAMRLDGDMYESTVDVLYHLYGKLSLNGYIIIDDWAENFPSRRACEDFFAVHEMKPTIVNIDAISAYWKKTEEVEIQYWRYEEQKFKPSVSN